MFLVCYPQGGWNDMMSRIMYCHKYCEATGRTLILDTSKNWFRDDFSYYFNLSLPRMFKGGNVSEFITMLYKKHSVFPSLLKGMNNDAFPPIIWKAPGHMETDTGIVVSTRLNVYYTETVVVYADCGSAIHINDILLHTYFTSVVLDIFHHRYKQLPSGYIGVHIRNTDYQSPVEEFIKQHESIFRSRVIFIASDHQPTINYFQKEYNALSFSMIPEVPPGKNIHESDEAQQLRTTVEQTRQFNIDTMVDFLLLAASSEFYFSSKQSGYSRSVAYLHSEQELVKKIIQDTRK